VLKKTSGPEREEVRGDSIKRGFIICTPRQMLFE
jgi:hypothetical protein